MAKHNKKRSKFGPTPADELVGTGMTFADLAAKFNVSASTFIGWMTGRIPGPHDLSKQIVAVVGHCPGCGRPAGEPCAHADVQDLTPASAGSHSFAPLDPARAAYLEERFVAAAVVLPRLMELRARLLKEGGVSLVAPPAEPDLDFILDHGRACDGHGALHLPGAPSECHRNVRVRWLERGPGAVQVFTGYALSPDGLWRQHSWAVEDGVVVETTVRRLKYFGAPVPDAVVLAEFEAMLDAAAEGAR